MSMCAHARTHTKLRRAHGCFRISYTEKKTHTHTHIQGHVAMAQTERVLFLYPYCLAYQRINVTEHFALLECSPASPLVFHYYGPMNSWRRQTMTENKHLC